MSEVPKNAYSELMDEIQRRGEEILATAPSALDPRSGEWEKMLASLVAEGERRFTELLASRQGTIAPDFNHFYKLKADLDRRMLTEPRDDRA